MIDGEWMEVAREFTHKYWDAGVDIGGILARAMAMVAEETREKVQRAIIKRSLAYQDNEPLVVVAQATDAEIIARLRARLKSEKGA